MLVGCRAFYSTSAVDTIAAILKDPAPDLSKLKIPAKLEAIIRKCLEKEPERRFQSAQGLLESLQEIKPGSKPAIRRSKKTLDSIAILPFVDVNPDPDTEYLADGITENIIHTLSQLPKLRVMARSTVFSYKGQNVDPVALGQNLDVRALLTGRLVHRGTRLSIQTELVDTQTGARFWGEDYTSKLEDLHNLEQKIASHITEKLRMKIQAGRKKVRKPTEVGEAYQFYLKGRYYWNKRTLEGFRRAIDCFDEAQHLDPKFALSYAGLADAYAFMGGYGYIPSREAYTKSKEEAIQALELDPSLAEAHTSLATVKYRYDWNWKGAEESFRKALELNPGYITAHHWYGVFLVLTGRFQEGLAAVRKAAELDPPIVIQWTLGYIYYYAREYDNALDACHRAMSWIRRLRVSTSISDFVTFSKEKLKKESMKFSAGSL